MKLVRLIKKRFKEAYSNVRTGIRLFYTFPIQNGIKGDALSPLLFNFTSEYVIRKVQKKHVGLKLNGTHQPLMM
jgi:hypothetical protein